MRWYCIFFFSLLHSFSYFLIFYYILTDGRRSKLIRAAAPGPYEDIVGPSVLAVVLICSIIAQFSIKLYSMV